MSRPAVILLFVSVSWSMLVPATSFGQSQTQTGSPQGSSPATASQSSQTQPVLPAKVPAKIWTNDDINVLGNSQSASLADATANTKKVGNSSKSVSQEKDGAWYRRQLVPLRAEIDRLDAQIAKLQAFLSGENVSDPPTMHRQLVPSPKDQLKQMEARRQADAAKMDDLLDRARHNGIQPGALR